jgi:general secretion pathway protein L
MSLLILLAPPRPRSAAHDGAAPGLAPAAEWSWVLTTDERTVERSGRSAPALWPAAARALLVLPVADVGWQTVSLPRGAAGRQRPALAGLLEERLLADPDDCHFALAPDPSRPGDASDVSRWIAVVDRAWLRGLLATIEAQGRLVDRVVPLLAPSADAAAPARLHVHGGDSADDADTPWVTRADARGVISLPLAAAAALRAAAAPGSSDSAVGWRASAEPAVAALAEQWHGQPVALQGLDALLLEAASSPWNLRQFDLVSPRRGWRAVRGALQAVSAPAWRPARWGLVALVGVQLVGLNAWAWQQERAVRERRLALTTLLQQTHPQVRTVVDAPLQMQRETERLRQAAGQPGDGDLEPLLAAVSAAWPDGLPPAQALRYEPGRVSLMLPGVDEPALAPLQDRLRALGLGSEWRDGRLVVSREGRR